MNGIGTSVCGARGHLKWEDKVSHDSVECLVVLFLPILPYKAVHTFDWNGTEYRAFPIRWSPGLVIRCFLRRWLMVPTVLAFVFAFLAHDELNRPAPPGGVTAEFPPPILGALSALGWWALNPKWAHALLTVFPPSALWGLSSLGWWVALVSDGRTKDIRRVLGPHSLGSSDPATWRNELLLSVQDPRSLHGTATYAEAVPALLQSGQYAPAMWAARLSTALEDRSEGEYLTDTILADPRVQLALVRVRKQPAAWAEAMHATSS